MLRLKNENRGITLVALVVTIIVLIILASISINLLFGNNGIITKTKEARFNYVVAANEEQKSLTSLEMDIEDSSGGEIDESTLDIPEDAVARIRRTFYSTLQNAFDAVEKNNVQTTVYLLKDITENVTTSEGQNILLNLNKHTIKNNGETSIITISGVLTIENGNVTGSYSTKIAPIYVNTNSTLNLSSAFIERDSSKSTWETIQLYGNLNMDSGTISNKKSDCICTYEGYDTNINISGTAKLIGSDAYSVGKAVICNTRKFKNNRRYNYYL